MKDVTCIASANPGGRTLGAMASAGRSESCEIRSAAQIVRAGSTQLERDDGRHAEESLRPISSFAVSSAWSHASATRYVRSHERRRSGRHLCCRDKGARPPGGMPAAQGLAGSISTAIPRHLPCLNLTTLSVARVAWPTTMAVQMWAGSRPYIAWNSVHSPSGMMTWEMIEM